MAAVDSSVGGKTGVNLKAGKNLAGAFWQPSLVLFDPQVLSTLSRQLKLDGIAEALKAGIIADPSIIEEARRARELDDPLLLTELAARAVRVKRDIVLEDEREKGARQLLNLGHTPAHAIETLSGYTVSHGHAVAMGISIISRAAERLGMSREGFPEKINALLQKAGFPLKCPYSAGRLAEAALSDKKRRGSRITLVIPEDLGSCKLMAVDISELETIFSSALRPAADPEEIFKERIFYEPGNNPRKASRNSGYPSFKISRSQAAYSLQAGGGPGLPGSPGDHPFLFKGY